MAGVVPKKEKVYQTTVIVDIYGCNSKAEAETFVEEALEIDGLFFDIGKVILLKQPT